MNENLLVLLWNYLYAMARLRWARARFAWGEWQLQWLRLREARAEHRLEGLLARLSEEDRAAVLAHLTKDEKP